MADITTPATPQDVLDKLNEATDAVQTAQEMLVSDVSKAMAKLDAHESDPNAHGGSSSGGGTSPDAITKAMTAHNNDPAAHGLNKPDSPLFQAIQIAADNAVAASDDFVTLETSVRTLTESFSQVTAGIDLHAQDTTAHPNISVAKAARADMAATADNAASAADAAKWSGATRYVSTAAPTASVGVDGDIYLQLL